MLKVFGAKVKFWTFTLKVVACAVCPARSPVKIKTHKCTYFIGFQLMLNPHCKGERSGTEKGSPESRSKTGIKV
jgi:hypothetical protein